MQTNGQPKTSRYLAASSLSAGLSVHGMPVRTSELSLSWTSSLFLQRRFDFFMRSNCTRVSDRTDPSTGCQSSGAVLPGSRRFC